MRQKSPEALSSWARVTVQIIKAFKLFFFMFKRVGVSKIFRPRATEKLLNVKVKASNLIQMIYYL